MQTSDLVQQLLGDLPTRPAPASSADYLAVPATQPRWLIPARGRNLAAALASWSPYRFSSRLKWEVIRAAHSIGVLQGLPQVETIRLEHTEQIDWRAMGWEHDSAPIVLIYVGTPGPRRKAVIHLVDPSTEKCKAIVKVPLGPEAKDAILREAEVLNALAAERYPFSPRLLHLDCESGMATQQFLPGTSATRRFHRKYWELLRSLVSPNATTTIAEITDCGLKRGMTPIADSDMPWLYEPVMAALSDEQLLPACRVHGDFAPWNIRRRSNGAAALIDWEGSQACGLPLHDTYHFLHMQDFLFQRRPTAHFEDVAAIAQSLGIARHLCRKLEIAYLAHTYAGCSPLGQQPARAEFVLRTLALVAGERPLSVSTASASSHRLRLVSFRSDTRTRTALFNAVITQLNDAGIHYCILSGYENNLGTQQSDVDIMFRPRDLHRVPDLLARAGVSAGAVPLQAIQHETAACYFVLARDEGRPIAHLDVDCYGDYRRDARTWLLADSIIAHRRQYGAFYVPAVADEFTYYLIKKVMKQSITLHQLKRLQQLFAHDPERCHESLATLWLPGTALLLERAIVDQGLSWLEVLLPKLLIELVRSRHPETLLSRGFGKLLEFKRLLRRIAFPTGLSVVVAGGDGALRSELADGLIYELAPAFRRVKRLSQAVSPLSHILQMFEICVGRMRSTLFIRTSDHDLTRPSTGRPFERLRSRCSRPFAGVNLALNLRAENVATSANGAVFLNSDDSSEQVLQNATRTILQLLAQRTQRRPKFPATVDRTSSVPVENSELRSVGLD